MIKWEDMLVQFVILTLCGRKRAKPQTIYKVVVNKYRVSWGWTVIQMRAINTLSIDGPTRMERLIESI